MPIALPALVVTLEAILLALVAYALLRTAAVWLRPQLYIQAGADQTKARKRRWFEYLRPTVGLPALFAIAIGQLRWLGQPIAKALRQAERYVLTALSHYVGRSLLPVARWLHGLAVLVHGLADFWLALPRELYRALYHLRHVTLPRYVAAALAPLVLALDKAQAELDTFERVVTDARIAVNDALAGIGRDVIGGFDAVEAAFARAFTDLWRQVYQQVVPRLNDLLDFQIPVLSDKVISLGDDLYNTGADSLQSLRTRLRELERQVVNDIQPLIDALTTGVIPLALVGAIALALEKVWPNLFCRNTSKATKALCGMGASDFDALFLLLAEGALIANFRTFVELAQGVARETAEGIQAILEV